MRVENYLIGGPGAVGLRRFLFCSSYLTLEAHEEDF